MAGTNASQCARASAGIARSANKQRTRQLRTAQQYHILPSRCVTACADSAAAAQSSGSKQQIPGLRKFINGIWDRKRHVPNNLYKDPLVTLFEDFDLNKDGMLTVDEITSALQSEGVQITSSQVEIFVKAADENENKVVDSHEFSRLIFKLADESAGDST